MCVIVGMIARMSWREPGVANRIPKAVARVVRERDGNVCQLRYDGCTFDAEEIDHIVNVASTGMGRADVNRRVTPEDLQCVCRACHRVKTAREISVGRNRWKRPRERHPGMRYE